MFERKSLKKDFDENYDETTHDSDDEGINQVDIKINPEFFIHHAFRRAQNCLDTPSLDTASFNFALQKAILFINQGEQIAKQIGIVDSEELEKSIEEQRNKIKEKNPNMSDNIVEFHLSNFKMAKILSETITSRPIYQKGRL